MVFSGVLDWKDKRFIVPFSISALSIFGESTSSSDLQRARAEVEVQARVLNEGDVRQTWIWAIKSSL